MRQVDTGQFAACHFPLRPFAAEAGDEPVTKSA
jgi:hypothetical protein